MLTGFTPALSAQETAVAAADALPSGSTAELEEIVVTGSRLGRNGYDTPTPVTVVDEQALEAAAPGNLANFVNELPSVTGSTTPATSNRSLSSGAAGISSINLRGLGNQRTLVLLDGRRSVGSLAQGTVDVNTFPQGLVKSVEVVTGGASATYGSDAVSGVVNFILDKEYTGIKGSIDAGETTYGDNHEWNATLTAGLPFADGRGHLLLNGQVSRMAGIYGMPRDWAQQGWHMVNNPDYVAGNGLPEYLVTNQSGQSVMTAGGIITNTDLRGTYFGVGGTVNQFAYGATKDPWTIGGDWRLGVSSGESSLEPESQRDGVFGRASFALTDRFEVFAEASWNENVARQWGGYQSDKGSIVIQADNAFIPASVAAQAAALGITQFNVGSYNEDIPTRKTDNDRQVTRYVLGANGNFDTGSLLWDWDGYYQHGETETTERLLTTNRTLLALAQDAVIDPDSGAIVCRSALSDPGNGCVPFNRMGIGVNDAAALDYFMDWVWREQKFKQDVYALNFSTRIETPWTAPVGLAMGGEHRREEISGYVPEEYQSGWTYGNYLPTFGKYNVSEVYLETLVPLPHGFEFNGAVRATDYSTSGRVTTWKAGVTWYATTDLNLRATHSRDIRAPNLEELYQAGRSRTNFVTDPFNGDVSTRFTETTTGNPDLDPEKADTWGFGLVYRPSFISGMGMSVDYFDIDISDAISSVDAQSIVDRCYEGQTDFCDAFTRDPTSETGNDLLIDNSPFNFVSEQARGVDLEASYSFALASVNENWAGQVGLRALATHYIEMSADNGVDPPTDVAGQNTGGGPPDWTYRFTLDYALDPFRMAVTGRGLSSGTYNNDWVACTSNCPESTSLSRTINTNHIDGAFYVDAYLSYKLNLAGIDNEFFFKVNNVFNKDPVVVGLGPGDSSNVEPGINRSLYDYLGRTFRVGVRFDWGG